ncbi:pyruvate/2-oxoglutarate dehydrogenase complex dihydrolipoamide dehydrogenase (E3) component [Arthrobacter sp. UYEF3]
MRVPGRAPEICAQGPAEPGTRGFIKIVTDADTGRIVGITAVAKDAGDLAAAGVYNLEARMTVEQVANLWSPYLTMAEGFKIAVQLHTTDISKLS